MECYALIEEWPTKSLVSFRELPGYLSAASTTEEAIEKAPQAITEYLLWLKQNNLSFLEGETSTVNVVVKERVRVERVGPLFESELVAPTDQEMTNALAVAATARTQIIDLYNGVMPAQRSRIVKSGEWSLTEHLQHLLDADAHYVGCLNEQLPDAMPPINEEELPVKFLENGMTYERFLRGLTSEQRARVYIHGEARWTVAKTLRRMTEHLRDHYPWMQAIAQQLYTSE